jgi:hypothetical protein
MVTTPQISFRHIPMPQLVDHRLNHDVELGFIRRSLSSFDEILQNKDSNCMFITKGFYLSSSTLIQSVGAGELALLSLLA